MEIDLKTQLILFPKGDSFVMSACFKDFFGTKWHCCIPPDIQVILPFLSQKIHLLF